MFKIRFQYSLRTLMLAVAVLALLLALWSRYVLWHETRWSYLQEPNRFGRPFLDAYNQTDSELDEDPDWYKKEGSPYDPRPVWYLPRRYQIRARTLDVYNISDPYDFRKCLYFPEAKELVINDKLRASELDSFPDLPNIEALWPFDACGFPVAGKQPLRKKTLEILASHCPNVRCLHLGKCDLDLADCEEIVLFRQLREIEVVIDRVSPEALLPLRNLTHLERILVYAAKHEDFDTPGWRDVKQQLPIVEVVAERKRSAW